MIKNYFLFFIFISSCHLFSQEVYLNTGKNFTKYSYKNSLGQTNSNLQSGTGNFYELGLSKPFIHKYLFYSVGISLNEYNAVGGNITNSYRWDTKYLGVNGGLSYSFFPPQKDSGNNLDLMLKAGVQGATIIYGKQQINGIYYDLVHQKEFSGLVLGSSMGLQLKYAIDSFGFLSLGYDFCQSINISNTNKEKLSFSTHQIGLGVHFPIN